MAEPIPTVVTAPNKWIPDCFHVTHECESSITGWVSSEGELKTVLEAHRRTCLCSFVSWSDDIKRKERTARRLVWRYDDIDADNAPFTIDNNVILCCQYGNPHKRDCIAEVLEDKFRLIGVVVHDGTPKKGHYRCFTQHGMQWFEINDMIIRRVPFASVKTAQAYILFYRALPRPYIN